MAMTYFILGIVMWFGVVLNANPRPEGEHGPLAYVFLFLLFLFWGLCAMELYNVFISRL